jgi:hypothetical protein
MIVDIRFNTNYPLKSKYEWKLLIGNEEKLVNKIICNVPTYTTSTFIEGLGMKWHMSANANDIIFTDILDKKHAEII